MNRNQIINWARRATDPTSSRFEIACAQGKVESATFLDRDLGGTPIFRGPNGTQVRGLGNAIRCWAAEELGR